MSSVTYFSGITFHSFNFFSLAPFKTLKEIYMVYVSNIFQNVNSFPRTWKAACHVTQFMGKCRTSTRCISVLHVLYCQFVCFHTYLKGMNNEDFRRFPTSLVCLPDKTIVLLHILHRLCALALRSHLPFSYK